ncbi:MAG: hypothetical protein ACFFF9_11560 [Candidatus Thorarchaeota archaeon]
MKRIGILLLIFILQITIVPIAAQDIIDGNQININLTLSDPIEHHAFCFADTLEIGTTIDWTFETSSSEVSVDFFIMDEGNWTIMDTSDEMVYPIFGIYEATQKYDSLEIPYSSTWYFVFRNPIGQESSVQITGTIVKTNPTSISSTTPTTSENWIDFSIILVSGSIMALLIVGYIAYKKVGQQ